MSVLQVLFGGKERSVMGIDVGSSSIKVVQLRKQHGKAVLETYGEIALGPYGDAEVGQSTNLAAEQIAEALTDLLREANVTSRTSGISIPFARSLLTLVKLPYRESPREQKTVIELEARKYIPVPVSEVQLDWFIVPDANPGESKKDKKEVMVLLVAVHNDEITLLQEAAQGAKLRPDFYEIEIFSTIRAVVDEPRKPVMVIDIGASTSKVYVVKSGVVAASHAINAGSQNVTMALASANNLSLEKAEAMKKEFSANDKDQAAATTVFSRIFSEARRMQTQFETENREPIAEIVLTGGGAVTKDLGSYAKNIFSTSVRVADPFAKTEAPAFMRPVLERIGPEFAVAVGIALRKLSEQ